MKSPAKEGRAYMAVSRGRWSGLARLLHSGVDVTVTAPWLGNEQVTTTASTSTPTWPIERYYRWSFRSGSTTRPSDAPCQSPAGSSRDRSPARRHRRDGPAVHRV